MPLGQNCSGAFKKGYEEQKLSKPVWRNHQHRGFIFHALVANYLITMYLTLLPHGMGT